MTFTQGHALLVGVGAYQDQKISPVPTTRADAEAVSAVLRDPRYCGYPAHQVSLLHNERACRHDILTALDTLASVVTEDDTVFFFYSGHGVFGDDGNYYLTTHDTRMVNHKVAGGTGVSQQELLERLRRLRAKRALLLFNACHAGALSPTLGGEQAFTGHSLPNQTTAALLSTGEGRVIITACRERQYSFVGNGECTIFGQALVDGLQGKGTPNQQGYISVFDLYTHLYVTVADVVKQHVPELYRKQYGETQEPELTIFKGVGSFAVALYRGTTATGAFTPQDTLAAETAVREVTTAQSQAAFQRIQTGGVDLGQHNKITIRGSVVSGDQHNVNTDGGDYAAAGIDKRQGITIKGGTIYGPVVGSNSGTITSTYGAIPPANSAPASLQQILTHTQLAIAQAQQEGDTDLAEDLDAVARTIQAALKAQDEGKAERRISKIHESQDILRRLAADRSQLQQLLRMLEALE